MKIGRSVIAMAAMSLAVPLRSYEDEGMAPAPKRGGGIRSYGSRMIGVPASINRHTGLPHEHRREKARRVRQAGMIGEV